MSYSFSVPPTHIDDIEEAFAKAFVDYAEPRKDDPTFLHAEVSCQVGALLLGLPYLVAGIGRFPEDETFTVSCNGHANPGHAPKDGYSPEYVTLTVSVVEG